MRWSSRTGDGQAVRTEPSPLVHHVPGRHSGGVFRLWDVAYNFDVDEAHDRIEEWCAPFGDEVGGDWARWEIEEHVRDEHSTFTWLLEAMIERSGFIIESADYSDDGFDAKYLLRAT